MESLEPPLLPRSLPPLPPLARHVAFAERAILALAPLLQQLAEHRATDAAYEWDAAQSRQRAAALQRELAPLRAQLSLYGDAAGGAGGAAEQELRRSRREKVLRRFAVAGGCDLRDAEQRRRFCERASAAELSSAHASLREGRELFERRRLRHAMEDEAAGRGVLAALEKAAERR